MFLLSYYHRSRVDRNGYSPKSAQITVSHVLRVATNTLIRIVLSSTSVSKRMSDLVPYWPRQIIPDVMIWNLKLVRTFSLSSADCGSCTNTALAGSYRASILLNLLASTLTAVRETLWRVIIFACVSTQLCGNLLYCISFEVAHFDC